MTYTQMISALPNENSSVERVGREFFSAQTSTEDRRALLEELLARSRYTQICKLIYCGHLNAHFDVAHSSADFMAVTGDTPTIHIRYFQLLRETAASCGIEEEKLLPLVFACASADKRSPLRVWQDAADRYLVESARRDYDRVWSYVLHHDSAWRSVSVLLRADRPRALVDLAHLAIFGKGVNKVAIRAILRGYPAETYAFVRSEYPIMKTDERIAAVRLLLMFKNDPDVFEFLQTVAATEKAKSVRKLLAERAHAMPTVSEDSSRAQIVRYFYEAMVRGTSATGERFVSDFVRPPYAQVADRLFFSVYEDGIMTKIVMIDEGNVLDLDNLPIELPLDCEVKVLHAVEITSKYEYLKRLKIEQPFEQVKRKTYAPTSLDTCSNCCSGMAGRIMRFADFRAGMRKLGFRMMNRDRDGMCRQVGMTLSGVVCVLDIAPTDFSAAESEAPILAYCVRFYREGDVIRSGGQWYVENVAPLSPAKIDARTFSECMYSVYELMGCQ